MSQQEKISLAKQVLSLSTPLAVLRFLIINYVKKDLLTYKQAGDLLQWWYGKVNKDKEATEEDVRFLFGAVEA